MPVKVSKKVETVRELHNELGKETVANTTDVNDSYKFSGPGHMKVPDEISDHRGTSLQFPRPLSSLDGLAVSEGGRVLGNDGRAVGKVVEGDPDDLVGQIVNGYGEILDEDGDLIGCVDPLIEDATRDRGRDYRVWGDDPGDDTLGREEASPQIDMRKKHYTSPEIIAETHEAQEKEMKVEVELPPPGVTEDQVQAGQEGIHADGRFPYISTLEGLTCNTVGEIITADGISVGELIDGDAMRISIDELHLDYQGQFKDGRGVVIGRARPLPSSQSQVWSNVGVIGETMPEPISESEEPGAPCAGFGEVDHFTVDNDGVVFDSSGRAVGRLAGRDRTSVTDSHLVLRIDAEPEPEPDPHAKHARFDMQNLTHIIVNDSGYVIDNGHLVDKMCAIVRKAGDDLDPLCRQITLDIEEANLKPRNRLAAEELVEDIRSPIISAGNILQDCNNSLRSLDPDGQIASTMKSHGHPCTIPDAMTSEYRLASHLIDLAQTVIDTITAGRHRLSVMSKEMAFARRKINPLWTLLSNRLFDIVAAVGLLHTGFIWVLSSMLNRPWLGKALQRLLIGIGLDSVLDRLGVERLLTALLDGEAWVCRAFDSLSLDFGDFLKAFLNLFGIHGVLESMRVRMVSEALELER
ncbi:hypothetical protein BDW67DRAFT_189105 [Aspergillus spinulosporus]